jgi:hypothetical protein
MPFLREAQMAEVTVLKRPIRPLYRDDCIVEGLDYPLIPEGQYEAVLVSYETNLRFSKKNNREKKVRQGGKIYFHFHVDPYNNAGLGQEKVILFMAFNAKEIILPVGKNGVFKVGARSNYAKLFNKLFPGDAKDQRVSPKNLMKKSLTVKVRTVTTNEKQKRLSEHERYSIVGDILEFA